MGDRCKVYDLDIADLDKAADDPALNALLEKGWTVLASVALAEGQASPLIRLVMRPPVTTGASATPAMFAGAVALGAAVGTLAGLFGAALLA